MLYFIIKNSLINLLLCMKKGYRITGPKQEPTIRMSENGPNHYPTKNPK